MGVRAKFICQRTEEVKYQGYKQTNIIFTAVGPYNSKDYDSKKFWEASPTGELKLGVVNQAAIDYFVPGKRYYLDFTEAPSDQELAAELGS
jgi:hypothetical protein